MKYFLDTNICIYYLRGQFPNIKEKILEKVPSQLKIPAIVKGELLLGAKKSKKVEENTNRVLAFLDPFEIISFDDFASVYYANIRNDLEKVGTIIGPNDLIISSIVALHEGTLVTNNTSEFSRVKELILENWSK